MSEERPETRSSINLSVTHDTTIPTASLSESQKVLSFMDKVFHKIVKTHPNVKVMIVSKPQRYLKSNYPMGNIGLQHSSCILNFTDLVHILMKKIYPDEPIENVRIKGKKDEIIVNFDENLDIIVIEKDRFKTGK